MKRKRCFFVKRGRVVTGFYHAEDAWRFWKAILGSVLIVMAED